MERERESLQETLVGGTLTLCVSRSEAEDHVAVQPICIPLLVE